MIPGELAEVSWFGCITNGDESSLMIHRIGRNKVNQLRNEF